MDNAQDVEVDRNYEAFIAMLPDLLSDHRGEYALMKDRKIVSYNASSWEALKEGKARFGKKPFSVQEVDDEPIDMGFFSHVAGAFGA
ncbi:MAG: hypothetical protein AAGD40_01175 [Pseudomonadota bacterium]